MLPLPSGGRGRGEGACARLAPFAEESSEAGEGYPLRFEVHSQRNLRATGRAPPAGAAPGIGGRKEREGRPPGAQGAVRASTGTDIGDKNLDIKEKNKKIGEKSAIAQAQSRRRRKSNRDTAGRCRGSASNV